LAEQRLAVTLRFFAGGAIHDLERLYELSLSECYDSIRECTLAVNEKLPILFPLDDPRALERFSQGFASLSPGNLFKGCVGAVDGVFFKQRCPGVAVDNPAR
jgi:hypothetical protein